MSDGEATAEVKPARVVFKVQSFVDVAQMKSDLAYSPNNLTDAMMQQASMFAHYGILAAQASKQVDTVKMLLDTTEAACYRILRDQKVKEGEKVTEAQLDKMVSRQTRVIDLKKAVNEAKQVESIAKTAMEAFRHRRDMLVQQGLISREEMKGEVAIAAKNAHAEAFELQQARVLENRRAREATN